MLKLNELEERFNHIKEQNKNMKMINDILKKMDHNNVKFYNSAQIPEKKKFSLFNKKSKDKDKDGNISECKNKKCKFSESNECKYPGGLVECGEREV